MGETGSMGETGNIYKKNTGSEFRVLKKTKKIQNRT